MANNFNSTPDPELLKHGRMIGDTFYPHSQFHRINGTEILLKQTPINFSPERLAPKPLPSQIKPADPLVRETNSDSDHHFAAFAWLTDRNIKKLILSFDYLANKDQAPLKLAELIKAEIKSSFGDDPLLNFYAKFQACIFLPKDLREEVWSILKKEYATSTSFFLSDDPWRHFATHPQILSNGNSFTKLLSNMLLEEDCPLNFILSILALQGLNGTQAIPGVSFNTQSALLSLKIEGENPFTVVLPLDPDLSREWTHSPALEKFLSLCRQDTIQVAPKIPLNEKTFSQTVISLLQSDNKCLQYFGLQLLANNQTNYALEIPETLLIALLSQSEVEVFKKFKHLSPTLAKLELPDSIKDPSGLALFCVKGLLGLSEEKNRIACNLWIDNLHHFSKEDRTALEHLPSELVPKAVSKLKKCASHDTLDFQNLLYLTTDIFQKHLEAIPAQELAFKNFIDLVRILAEKTPEKPLDQDHTKRLTALLGWSINQLILKKTYLVEAHELLMAGFAKEIFKKDHPKVLGLCKLLMRKGAESELSPFQKAHMWMDLYQKGVWDLYQQNEEAFKQFIEHAKAICKEKQNPQTILHYQFIEILLEQSLKKDLGAVFHDEIYDFIRRLGCLGQTEKTRALALFEKHKNHFTPSERITLHELILSGDYTPGEQYNDLLFLLSFPPTDENVEAAARIHRSVLKGVNKSQAADLILNLAKKMPGILDAAEIFDQLKSLLPENKDKIMQIVDLLLSEIIAKRKYNLEIQKSLFSLIDALKPLPQNFQNSLQKGMKDWVQEVKNQNNLQEAIRLASIHSAFPTQDVPYIKEYSLWLLQKIAEEKMDAETCIQAVEYAKAAANRIPRKQEQARLFTNLMLQTHAHHLHDLSLECLNHLETFECGYQLDDASFACLNSLLLNAINANHKEQVVFVLNILHAHFTARLAEGIEKALELAADKPLIWIALSKSYLSLKAKEISPLVRQQAESLVSNFAHAPKSRHMSLEQAWKILVEFEIDDVEIWSCIVREIFYDNGSQVDLVTKFIKNHLQVLKNLKKNLHMSQNLWLAIILALSKSQDKEAFNVLLNKIDVLETFCPRTEIENDPECFVIYLELVRGCIAYFNKNHSEKNNDTILNVLVPLKGALMPHEDETHVTALKQVDLALLDLLTKRQDEKMFFASLKLLGEIMETHQSPVILPENAFRTPPAGPSRLVDRSSVDQIISDPLKRIVKMWSKFIPPLDPIPYDINIDSAKTHSSYLSLILILTAGKSSKLCDDFEFIYHMTLIDNRSLDIVIQTLFFEGMIRLQETYPTNLRQKVIAQRNSINVIMPYVMKYLNKDSLRVLLRCKSILPLFLDYLDNHKLFEIVIDKIIDGQGPKTDEEQPAFVETSLKLFRVYLDKLPAGAPLSAAYCILFANFSEFMLKKDVNENSLALHNALFRKIIDRTDDLYFGDENEYFHPCFLMETALYNLMRNAQPIPIYKVVLELLLDHQKVLLGLNRFVPPQAAEAIMQKMVFSPLLSLFSGKRVLLFDKILEVIRKNKIFAQETLVFDAFYFFVNRKFPRDTKHSQLAIIEKLLSYVEDNMPMSSSFIDFLSLICANKSVIQNNAPIFKRFIKVTTLILGEDHALISDKFTAAIKFLMESFLRNTTNEPVFELNLRFDTVAQVESIKMVLEFANSAREKLAPGTENYIHVDYLFKGLQVITRKFPELLVEILDIDTSISKVALSSVYTIIDKLEVVSGSALEKKKFRVLDNLTNKMFDPNGYVLTYDIEEVQLNEIIKSAEAGSVIDQCNLARIYLEGSQTIQIQISKGLKWLETALAADSPQAYLIKGKWLYEGKKDWVQAVEYLKKAGNNPEAWYHLYLIYWEGSEEVPKDIKLAGTFLYLSSIAKYYPAIIAEASQYCNQGKWDKAIDLLVAESVLKDCAEAWVLSGDIYRFQAQTQDEESKAVSFYKNSPHPCFLSRFRFGCCYKFGFGLDQNDEEANIQFGILRKMNDANELLKMYLYLKDSFIQEDKKFLTEFLYIAALRGSPEALRLLAKHFQEIKNPLKAFETWSQLEKFEDGEAFYELGNHFLLHNPCDLERAKHYFEKAVNGNHVPAAKKAREMLSQLTNKK